MQGMLMTPTNPAYLYALQNRTLLLVCRMHLCFPISTFQLILLQNHPFLVSCELLKVAILLYSACTVFCLFYTTFDVTYLGWHSTLKSTFVFFFFIAENWKQSLVTLTHTLTRNCCRFIMVCPRRTLWVRQI